MSVAHQVVEEQILTKYKFLTTILALSPPNKTTTLLHQDEHRGDCHFSVTDVAHNLQLVRSSDSYLF